MENNFSKAMAFRHACKVFDETKKISDEDIKFILEAGRTSPTSFGIEAWKFLVITNEELKAKIRPYCWNQEQVTSCSHLVLLLSDIDSAKVESGEIKRRFTRYGLPEDKLEGLIGIYADHLKETLSSDENIHHWTSKQAYIAAGNMMTGAAYVGIDSCAIEGFEKENVEKVLGLDSTKHQLALVLPFGYRVNEQKPQQRLDFDEIVEFIN